MADELSAGRRTALTVDIVGAFVGGNAVAATDLPALIRSVHDALDAIGQSPPAPEITIKATSAQIRKSITPSALISFEDGKPYKTLKRHLNTHGLTIETYRAKWGLPADYPSVAASYSEARSAMAKALGLGLSMGGRKPRGSARKKAKA